MKSLDLTADVFLFYNNCYRETIHDCSYTGERVMSYVSPYSSVLWVTATISITACVQQMVPETRDVYRRRPPSRGMRHMVKGSQINFMLPQETHHNLLVRIHLETRTRREKKAPHAPMDLWLTCRRLAWSFSVLQYATADGRGGQSPGNRRRSSEHDHMHAWYIR